MGDASISTWKTKNIKIKINKYKQETRERVSFLFAPGFFYLFLYKKNKKTCVFVSFRVILPD
jgi:hypothetical protein